MLFAFNRAKIRLRAASALREVARSIERRSSGGPIRVEGHSDGKGDPAYNQRLSLRRAQAVRRWLIEKGDLDADRLSVRGFGETRPVAPNEKSGEADNPRGRRENRRVVIGVGRR